MHPDAPLILRAVPPTEATVSALRITDTTDLTVDGLQVQPPATPPDGIDPREHFLVVGDATSDRITLTNLRVESADSSATWTVADWARLSWSGIDLAGADATVSHSTIHNTHHALLLRGDRAHATTNLIDNFGGDGIRGLASGSTYEWNTVRDAYIDDYAVQHDDAFQAYELEGDLRISDVTLRHNRFVLFADPITEFVRTEHLIATLMQGVVITDGYADGWVVEGNLVVNSQAHGITLYGAPQQPHPEQHRDPTPRRACRSRPMDSHRRPDEDGARQLRQHHPQQPHHPAHALGLRRHLDGRSQPRAR